MLAEAEQSRASKPDIGWTGLGGPRERHQGSQAPGALQRPGFQHGVHSTRPDHPLPPWAPGVWTEGCPHWQPGSPARSDVKFCISISYLTHRFFLSFNKSPFCKPSPLPRSLCAGSTSRTAWVSHPTPQPCQGAHGAEGVSEDSWLGYRGLGRLNKNRCSL